MDETAEEEGLELKEEAFQAVLELERTPLAPRYVHQHATRRVLRATHLELGVLCMREVPRVLVPWVSSAAARRRGKNGGGASQEG